jgi:hypothetical protein
MSNSEVVPGASETGKLPRCQNQVGGYLVCQELTLVLEN